MDGQDDCGWQLKDKLIICKISSNNNNCLSYSALLSSVFYNWPTNWPFKFYERILARLRRTFTYTIVNIPTITSPVELVPKGSLRYRIPTED